jgi:endonuclease/exonuclease/phosphatase family metal-dependent hydrolase
MNINKYQYNRKIKQYSNKDKTFIFNTQWCCDQQIKPLYLDIDDYFEPLKRFSKENNNIFDNIVKNKILNDLVIQYYIKSRVDISIIILYPKAKSSEKIKEMMTKLEENGSIHYTKDIEFTYYAILNLIYQLYASEKRMKKISDIIYKADRIGFVNDGVLRKVKVIVYTCKNNIINGSSAPFKMELRDLFLQEDIKTTKFDNTDERYPRGYDYLHVSDNINQSYEYAGIFFNENSLRFLEKQKVWRLIEMNKTKNLFDKLKNFFYNYSQLELEKLLIFSSGVLYSYGIREANDLDCILLENDVIKPNLIEKLNNTDLDISFKGTKDYNDIWEKELNNRAKLFGAKNYKELILDPEYYYYFMGVKIIRLKYDITLRLNRNRPAQITDLLVIRQMFNLNYKITIPTQKIQFNEKLNKDESIPITKNKLLDTIQHYLFSRYYIKLNPDQIEKWINMSYKKSIDLFGGYKVAPTFYKKKIGGSLDNTFIKLKNIANEKYIYPTQNELIEMGYNPMVIIYSSDKPYLYPDENFNKLAVTNFCNKTITNFKSKKSALRIASFNVHNFISRCNQGIAPLFDTKLNPFENPRDINKFIELFKTVNADILCLQEVVPPIDITEDITDLTRIRNEFNFEYLNKLMAEIGYEYKIIGSTQMGHFFDTEKRDYYFLANAIYSKLPLKNKEIVGYKYLNRNIITASVKYKGKDIQILNLHSEYYSDKNLILKKLGISTDQVLKAFEDMYNLIKSYKNKNIIICGDFNIDLFKEHEGPRYKLWSNKTLFIRNNYNNTNKVNIPTNFSQNQKTDFILLNKNSILKTVYSFTYLTNISDHYMVLTDFV